MIMGMRRSFEGEVLTEKDRFYGFNLGADFCAEHEWGIKGIRNAFGIGLDSTQFGIENRRVTSIPEDLEYKSKYSFKTAFNEHSEMSYLFYANLYGEKGIGNRRLGEFAPSRSRFKNDEKNIYGAAWSEDSFAVSAIYPHGKDQLKELHTAIKKKEAAIWLGGGGFFLNSGLVIAIIPHLPADIIEKMAAADKERFEVEKEVAASGIREFLEQKGKKYFALSPRREASGKIVYWLNPYEQDIHNYGWFHEEDLRQWADNKGPIMMKKKG